ncbi:ROK family protein [Actinobaculum suis]|uniref:ROK family protein n=1 Tax=Actinobaculum suis TaxID=1657 RepID=UPI00066FEE67|nr:ROK family protein [Actinobaculum suis]
MKPGKNATSIRQDNLRLILCNILAAGSATADPTITSAPSAGEAHATLPEEASELREAAKASAAPVTGTNESPNAAPLASPHETPHETPEGSPDLPTPVAGTNETPDEAPAGPSNLPAPETATGLSRAKLAQSTGLTRATVSRLTDELISAGMIEELEPVRPQVGRPAAPLAAQPGKNIVLALEINLEYVAIYALDLAGNVLTSRLERSDSRGSDPAVVLAWISRLAGEEASKLPAGQLLSTVLCVPGLVDTDRRTIVTAPNLGWQNVDAGVLLDFPGFDAGHFRVINEADAAAFSVFFSRPGVRAGYSSFLYVSAEVGVGAAIFFEGQLFSGDHGWAGEIGHMCVDRSGPKCRCGSNGCLEQYAGFDSIVRNAGYAAGAEGGKEMSLAKLSRLFDAGDPGARAAIDACAQALGTTIANVLNLLDLRLVVLGGNFARLYHRLEIIMKAEIEYRVLGRRWEDVQIETSAFGDFAASRGGCLAGFAEILNHPARWHEYGIPISFD